MFGRKPEYMLNNPAARWRTMPGLEPELRGHPAPEYISRRSAGGGPSYGEGFGSTVGADHDPSSLRGIEDETTRFRKPSRRPRGIQETYQGPTPGFQHHRSWRE